VEITTNKKKIFNDPIYGFISVNHDIILDLIDHPYYQRLRRIKQLGLSHLVYPGALHTRFHHALGCTYLMQMAIDTLRNKGHEITEEEACGVTIAILLHDIGHGPFSHALEHSIVKGVSHEDISLFAMERLNTEMDGQLSVAISIFKGIYHKKFLHQLVSSQLDIDRLDYLKRDSFYSGVSEGVISSDRIINMLDIADDHLVVQQKGIYSIEKFVIARRLMYWQVYLHKTVISAEFMLIAVCKRAKFLCSRGENLFSSPSLAKFLERDYTTEDFENDPTVLDAFMKLDDNDLMGAFKVWMSHSDKVLSELSRMIVDRDLFKIQLQNDNIPREAEEHALEAIQKKFDLSEEDAKYFVIRGALQNNAYNPEKDRINLLFKDGTIKDISEASDSLNIKALAGSVEKHFLCHPKL